MHASGAHPIRGVGRMALLHGHKAGQITARSNAVTLNLVTVGNTQKQTLVQDLELFSQYWEYTKYTEIGIIAICPARMMDALISDQTEGYCKAEVKVPEGEEPDDDMDPWLLEYGLV